MPIYKYIDLSDDKILLEKVSIDETKFDIEILENGNKILRKKITISNIDEIKDYDFSNSNILNCEINDKSETRLKYKSILESIYYIINDGTKIIKNTKLNILTLAKTDSGFYYLEKIGISVQGVSSDKCLFEIMNQCIKNKIKITMRIKLFNGKIVNIK